MAHPHCWNYIDILSEISYDVNTVKLEEEMQPEINEIGLAALLSLPTAGIVNIIALLFPPPNQHHFNF